MYTRRDYREAGEWVRATSPDDAARYAEDYGDDSVEGLGKAFAEAVPDYFDDIVRELRAER